MATYLLTWNPDITPWFSNRKIKQLKQEGFLRDDWSCANCKSIRPGDRIFLIKLGRKKPNGICASGDAIEYKKKRGSINGKKENYVDIEFDTILNPDKDPILELETLRQIKPEYRQLWTPQSSGITIKPEVASELEKIWSRFRKDKKIIGKTSFMPSPGRKKDVFTEGNPYRTTITKYERDPYARKRCIEHYGTSCIVCEFSFLKKYGALGKDFIHVHHLVPVSRKKKRYKLNPIKDLRPVCPNCHAMIHIRRPPLTIEELQKRIRN
jgi:5-methylcytosine-specific restriction protein A